MQRDGSLDITESIVQDFGQEPRRGIIRVIPVDYHKDDGSTFHTDFRLQSVKDQYKDELETTLSHHDGDVVLTIGDRNQTVTGRHTYNIRYTLRRAINFFNHEPEVYLNAVGDEWKFPIASATALLYLPEGTDLRQLKLDAWVEPKGSQRKPDIVIAGDGVAFQANKLNPGEGLTIAARLPAGSMAEPSPFREAIWFFTDWWLSFFIPAAVCACMWLIWWGSGRDDDAGTPAAAEWQPPKDLTPAEVGTLVDEKCDMQDIVSTLVDLAVRGYIKIKEVESSKPHFFTNKDYQFTRLTPREHDTLSEYERLFLQAIFGIGSPPGTVALLSSLQGSVGLSLFGVRDAIYKSMLSKRLFHQNPDDLRKGYNAMAWATLFISLCVLTASHTPAGVGLLLGSAVIALWSRAMPARTAEGTKKTRESLGFRRFVSMAEKERIRVISKDDPTVFGRLLPYAMVLGAADQWAEACKDLLKQPPDWYEPYGYGTAGYLFTPNAFVHDLGGGLHCFEHAFAPTVAPKSSPG